MDEVINSFLAERKGERLKKKIKTGMSESERTAVEQAVQAEFSLVQWLPNAATRAPQLSMVTHPGKFSHPSAKISPVIAVRGARNDGYLRTGNVSAACDVLGNAAAIDVYKFLSLQLKDGKTVLQHLEENTPYIQDEFAILTTSYETIRNGLLAIKRDDAELATSGRIKQVYFPVEDDYHLLSILTPSGGMFLLRDRVDAVRFSDRTKEGRDAKRQNAYSEQGFDELFDLTVIGYGGTKPQNISVLNNRNGGKAYLLPSMPPVLAERTVQPPRKSFFVSSVRTRNFTDLFVALHNLIVVEYNNIHIREGRDKIIQAIIDRVVARMWSVRQLEPGWSASENCARLSVAQKVWLDNGSMVERESNDEWLEEIISEFSRWVVQSYKKVLGARARLLGDVELAHIRRLVDENREVLR